MDYMINNVTVVTMDDEMPILKNAFVGVSEGKIAFISDRQPRIMAREQIDGRGKLIMPGLINAHTHLAMGLMRGYADDTDLQTWLNDHIFPVEHKMDGRAIYLGTMLGAAEALRFGITSVSDMYISLPNVASALLESGIKANISNGATGYAAPTYDIYNSKEYGEMYATKTIVDESNGRLKLDVGIHAEYTSDSALRTAWGEYAKQNGNVVHVHLSETKHEHDECVKNSSNTPAALLEREGLFRSRTIAAHCVWLTDDDIDILHRNNVTVVHNPVSNLKLGSGIARIAKMHDAGINIALGTDGASSNNNLDLFEEIKLAAILQKGATQNPEAIPAYEALKMATVNGAYAQGRENECGKLRVGYDADIIMLDLASPHLFPIHDYHSLLCYSARGGDVCMTMVQGRILYKDGKYTTIDIEKLKEQIERFVMPELF